MGIVKQVLAECDRCQQQFQDETRIRRVSINESPVQSGGFPTNLAGDWTSDECGIDLCRGCVEELESVWMEFISDENALNRNH